MPGRVGAAGRRLDGDAHARLGRRRRPSRRRPGHEQEEREEEVAEGASTRGASTDAPRQLFDRLLAADPGRPFVTYYDEASGERSELSRKSLANWVAKTHFLLIDELGLGVGDTALIALPAHWISVPADPRLPDRRARADRLGPAATSRSSRRTGCPSTPRTSTRSHRRRPRSGSGETVPDGAADYVSAVRPQADAWAGVRLAADTGRPLPARRSPAPRWSPGTRTGARELGAGDGARLLSTRDWSRCRPTGSTRCSCRSRSAGRSCSCATRDEAVDRAPDEPGTRDRPRLTALRSARSRRRSSRARGRDGTGSARPVRAGSTR